MKRATLIIGFMLLIVLAGQAQSLNDYLEMAANNNPGLKAKYKLYLAALEAIDQNAALPDPTLSFGYFISPVETRVGPQQFRISLTQMFPWKGTLPLRKKAASQLAQLRFEEFMEAKNQLFLKIQLKWLALYELEKEIRIIQENLDLLKTYEPVTRTKYEANLVSLSDLVRVQINLEAGETELALLKLKRKPLRAEFNLLLNRDEAQAVSFEGSLRQYITTKPTFDSMMAASPQIKAARMKIEMAKTQIGLAGKQTKPNIGLGLDYTVVSKRADAAVSGNGRNILMPRVSISLPIFKKKNRARQNLAKLTKESHEANLVQIENELKKQWIGLEYELEKATKERTLYQSEIDKTNLLLKVLTAEYTNNNRDFEEVLATRQRLLMLQLSAVRAELRYQTAVYQLEYLSANTLTQFE